MYLSFYTTCMAKNTHREILSAYMVKTPDGYFNHKKLSNREQEILMNSVSYYVNLRYAGHDGINESIKKRFGKIVSGTGYEYLQKHLANDSMAIRNFPQWWSRYFSSGIKYPCRSGKCDQNLCVFKTALS